MFLSHSPYRYSTASPFLLPPSPTPPPARYPLPLPIPPTLTTAALLLGCRSYVRVSVFSASRLSLSLCYAITFLASSTNQPFSSLPSLDRTVEESKEAPTSSSSRPLSVYFVRPGTGRKGGGKRIAWRNRIHQPGLLRISI